MATLTYKEQLLHPNWQRKRLEILQRDDFTCKLCCDTEATLHVHHKQYAKGRMAWEYPNEELVTLCEECHDTMHEQQGMLRDVTVLYQRHKRIFPYGYPYAYVPNIHHQYIMILQNMKKA